MITPRNSGVGLPLALAILVLSSCGGTAVGTPPVTPSTLVPPTLSPETASSSTGGLASPTASATPEVTPEPTIAPPPAWPLFRSPMNGFTIQYPFGFSARAGKTNREADTFEGGANWFNLDRLGPDHTFTLPSAVKFDISRMKKLNGAKKVSEQALRIDGEPARMVTFAGKLDGVPTFSIDVFVVKGSYLWASHWESPAGSEALHKAFFLKVLATFKFA